MPFIVFNKHANFDTSWCDEVVNVMRPNVLGNPFPLGKHNRDIAIAKYREYLIKQLQKDRLVLKNRTVNPIAVEITRLANLHREGKYIALICCCVPLPCHAKVIAEICSMTR